jgi:TP901 family phage tail tape measure protein
VKLQEELKGMKKGSAEATQALGRLAEIGKRQGELRKELGLTGLSLKELRGLAAKLEAQLKTMVPGSEQWVEINGELIEVKQRIDAVGTAAGRQAAAWEVLRKDLQLTDMTMQQLNQEQKRLKQLLDTTHPNSPEWRAYAQELQRVEAQQTQLNQQMSGGQKLWAGLKSNVSGLITGMVGIGAAVYGAFRLFGDAAQRVVAFDKALSQVKALGPEYKANIEALAAAAREAGTAFGYTATESVAGIEALAKAGVSAKDILGGGLEGALSLAAAGQLDVATAAETASKAMTQFGLSGKDIPHLADLLASAANTATGDVEDFSAALGQSGTVLAQYNIPIEEAVGTLTAFASAGLLGSDAGTSFKTMVTRLGAPTETAAKAMADLNIQTYGANGQFLGLTNIAGQLKDRLGPLTEAQRNAALSTIFGTDAIRAANILYKAGSDGIRDYTAQVNQSGFAAKVAGEKQDNLAGTTTKLIASWENFVLSVESGSGVIGSSVRGLLNVFAGLLDVLSDLNGGDGSVGAWVRNAEKESKQFQQAGGTFKKGAAEYGTGIRDLTKRLKELRVLQQQNVNDGFYAAASANEEEIRSILAVVAARKQLRQTGPGASAADPASVQTLETLRVKLKALRDEREKLNVADTEGLRTNAASIAALESRIAQLDGTEKATKKVTDGMVKLREQLADIQADLYRDSLTADEAGVAQIDQKYATLRAAILAEETHTAEDLKALDEVYTQERVNAIEAQGQKRLEAYDLLALEAAKRRQEAEDRLADRNLTPQQAEVQGTLSEFDLEATNFIEGSSQMIALREQYEKKLTDIEAKYTQQRIDAAKQERINKIQNFTETAQAVGFAVGGLQAILSASAAAQGKSAAEQAEFQRTLALTQIGIATAVGIANALKNINEPFPANLIAITTSIGAVMAGIGQAMGVLNATPPAPAAPGSGGGTLNNVPLGADGMVLPGPGHDQGGLKIYDPLKKRVVAEVEGDELLMSKKFTRANAGILPQLLAASKAGTRLNFISSPLSPINTGAVRSAMVPMYAQGGRLNSSSRGTALVNATAPGGGGGGGGTPEWAAAMLGKMERVARAVEQMPTTLNAEVVLNPTKDRTEKRYAAVKARNTYRRNA